MCTASRRLPIPCGNQPNSKRQRKCLFDIAGLRTFACCYRLFKFKHDAQRQWIRMHTIAHSVILRVHFKSAYYVLLCCFTKYFYFIFFGLYDDLQFRWWRYCYWFNIYWMHKWAFHAFSYLRTSPNLKMIGRSHSLHFSSYQFGFTVVLNT